MTSSLILWTQLPDPTARDVIDVDGVILGDLEHARREIVVTEIAKLARSRRRREFNDGGFIAWSGNQALAEIPVRAPNDRDFFPVVTVALEVRNVTQDVDQGAIVTSIAAFTAGVGYSPDVALTQSFVQHMVLGLRPTCLTPWRR